MASLDLLYADPKALPRMRKLPSFPKEPEEGAAALLDIAGIEGADELGILEALDKGTAADSPAITLALQASVRPDGRFAPPLLVVEGDLALSFDAVEELKVTVTTALPFAPGDDDMSASLKAARDFLEASGDVPSATVAQSLASRILASFTRVRRPAGQDYLEREVQRALVEQRRNKVGMHAGAPHARATLGLQGERSPLLCFVPKPALPYLPLASKLQGRMIVEATPLADQYESHAFALRLVAVARRLSLPRS